MLLFRLEMVKTKMITQEGSEIAQKIVEIVSTEISDALVHKLFSPDLKRNIHSYLDGKIILDKAELREIIVDQERLMNRENVPKRLRYKNHSITIEEILGDDKIESS